MAKYEVEINVNQCKGCEICVQVCKKECLEITDKYNNSGYFYPVVASDEECTGCGACVKLCPDHAVKVYELIEQAA